MLESNMTETRFLSINSEYILDTFTSINWKEKFYQILIIKIKGIRNIVYLIFI